MKKKNEMGCDLPAIKTNYKAREIKTGWSYWIKGAEKNEETK